MANKKTSSGKVLFSLHETSKPKFSSIQIRIDGTTHNSNAGLPKVQKKLIVGRTGKIEFSK